MVTGHRGAVDTTLWATWRLLNPRKRLRKQIEDAYQLQNSGEHAKVDLLSGIRSVRGVDPAYPATSEEWPGHAFPGDFALLDEEDGAEEKKIDDEEDGAEEKVDDKEMKEGKDVEDDKDVEDIEDDKDV